MDDAPLAIALLGDHRLNGISFGVQPRLSGWNRPHDCANHTGTMSQKAHVFNFADVCGGRFIGKDLTKMLADLRLPVDLASVEGDNAAIIGEKMGEIRCAASIPAVQ